MKKLLTLLAFCPVALLAQTTWEVEAGGSMLPGNPDPYYSPADIVIDLGDAVHWTAVSGSHNVYGMPDAFPANPEGFTSGEPSSNLNYTHTFTIPGLYGYHCTQNGHAATQHGTITVLDPQRVGEQAQSAFTMFPVPARSELHVVRPSAGNAVAEILNLAGQVMARKALDAAGTDVLSVGDLQPGTYFLMIRTAGGTSKVRSFVKQ